MKPANNNNNNNNNNKFFKATMISNNQRIAFAYLVCLLVSIASASLAASTSTNNHNHDDNHNQIRQPEPMVAPTPSTTNTRASLLSDDNHSYKSSRLVSVEQFCLEQSDQCQGRAKDKWQRCAHILLDTRRDTSLAATCVPEQTPEQKANSKATTSNQISSTRHKRQASGDYDHDDNDHQDEQNSELDFILANEQQQPLAEKTSGAPTLSSASFDRSIKSLEIGHQEGLAHWAASLEDTQQPVQVNRRTLSYNYDNYAGNEPDNLDELIKTFKAGQRALDVERNSLQWLEGQTNRPQAAHIGQELWTRARRQPSGLHQQSRRASTIRVSAEQAKRFLEAQQRPALAATQRYLPPVGLLMASTLSGASGAALLMGGGVGGPAVPGGVQRNHVGQQVREPARRSQQQQKQHQHAARLQRSDNLQHQEPLVELVERNQTLAGQQQQQQPPAEVVLVGADGRKEKSSAAAAAAAADSPMECKLKRYKFTASKVDQFGNKCSGEVVATICYGGCDTGEIADWLFPYKKSIHKVCRHGQRVRRRKLLTDCEWAGSEAPVDPQLREYHYVDAASCVCKKCTSIDTTCLGTMSRPHLEAGGSGAGAGAGDATTTMTTTSQVVEQLD